jgi:hypothetical protein
MIFDFAADHFIWIFFKLILTLILMITIFRLRANPKLDAHKKPFWCLIITLLATFICDILTIAVLKQETKYFRERAPVFFAFYFPDLVLMAVLTWAMI